MISSDTLQAILPSNDDIDEWVQLIEPIFEEYEINTNERAAAFLAQTGHESLDFTVLKENLNYSAKGLLGTFGKYFTPALAEKYARKPEMIANRVYANRMGNGDEASGDGWRFRGRGILQVTGKNNYAACSQFLFGDNTLVENPDLLLEKEYALKSACWYWAKNKLNLVADTGDQEAMCRKINGGLNGLDDRVLRYNNAIEALISE